jgi:hypothetical protein
MDDATVYRDYHEAEIAKRDKRIRELEEALKRHEIERDRERESLIWTAVQRQTTLEKVTAERDEAVGLLGRIKRRGYGKEWAIADAVSVFLSRIGAKP